MCIDLYLEVVCRRTTTEKHVDVNLKGRLILLCWPECNVDVSRLVNKTKLGN